MFPGENMGLFMGGGLQETRERGHKGARLSAVRAETGSVAREARQPGLILSCMDCLVKLVSVLLAQLVCLPDWRTLGVQTAPAGPH